MSDAEALLDLARVVMVPKDHVVDCGDVVPIAAGIIALALKLRAQNPSFKLRAMVEGWDRFRIVRELY